MSARIPPEDRLRPRGPVPVDARHLWYDKPITWREARVNFVTTWERSYVPYLVTSPDSGDLLSIHLLQRSDLVLLYVHQHVRSSSIHGRWCCPVRITPEPAAEPTVPLGDVLMRWCSVPDCDRPMYVNAMCSMHYLRWRRHGDVTVRDPRGRRARELSEIVLDRRRSNIGGHTRHVVLG